VVALEEEEDVSQSQDLLNAVRAIPRLCHPTGASTLSALVSGALRRMDTVQMAVSALGGVDGALRPAQSTLVGATPTLSRRMMRQDENSSLIDWHAHSHESHGSHRELGYPRNVGSMDFSGVRFI
jgi:hypothetical protein